MKNKGLLLAVAASLTLAGGTSAAPADDGWLAWLGCWRAVGSLDGQVLCIVPDAGGVKMLGIENGMVKNETRVIADNQPRQASQEGCAGMERAYWSKDHSRVFLRAELRCGENIRRDVSGILALVSGTEMVSVQAVTSNGNTWTRNIRYTYTEPASVPAVVTEALAGNRLARESARQAASARIDLDDVREAVANVNAEAVQAWLTAANQPFDLDGKKLRALSKAGVPGPVIDVMVAVSNPRFFALEPAAEDERADRTDRDRRTSRSECWGLRMYDPWLDPFGYSFYGYNDACRRPVGWYGYSPYGYSPYYYGNGLGGWRYGPPVIVVREDDEKQSNGRVTRRGYSSGRSDSGSSISGGGYSRPSGGSTSSGSSSGSSSSGGGSTGRTAKPRGGN